MQTYLDESTPKAWLLLAVPVLVIAYSVTIMMSTVFHAVMSELVRNVPH
jgi:uncharacterized membrane protein